MGNAALFAAARTGDEDAWPELVRRYDGLIRAVVSQFSMNSADSGDAVQNTWLRLFERADTVREPEKLGAWLATTARREAFRHLRLHGRELASDEADLFEAPVDDPLEVALLTEERDTALWRAFSQLSDRCQTLLRLLVAEDEPSYEAISAALDMPIGSIGPTRQRGLKKVRTIVNRDRENIYAHSA